MCRYPIVASSQEPQMCIFLNAVTSQMHFQTHPQPKPGLRILKRTSVRYIHRKDVARRTALKITVLEYSDHVGAL